MNISLQKSLILWIVTLLSWCLVSSCADAPVATIAPSNPTSPPIESSTAVSAATDSPLPSPTATPTVVTFHGDTIYNDDSRFTVNYHADQWQEFVKDSGATLLQHREITGCTLDLRAGAFERGEPAKAGTLVGGNYQWRWGLFPTMGRIFYGIMLDKTVFLLEIVYDKTFSTETIAACQAAAEAVIATFQPITCRGQLCPASNISQAPLNQGGEVPSDEWATYVSKVGGYSIDYPASYLVTEHEIGHVQLRPSADSPPDKIITLMYLSFEIEDNAEFLEWLKLYSVHNEEGQYDVTFTLIDERHVYMESTKTSPIPLQAHLLVNGNLVLRLSVHDTDDSRSEQIARMVQSIKFLETAPKDLRQLYAPAPPPPITSLTEFVNLFEEHRLVERSLQIRTDTGETPTDLLEQMSEQARRHYEVTLKANQKLIEDLDRQRETPLPTSDTNSESD